ncbi:hypothetical protein [Zavarzinella formosa]|uniref:hypothetical protein n=1 Tax=Zavarzinella formosa TaxID=360055 RepID=UPI000382A520|nr:hypothetical protein [Zavarzinella formosa]
MYRPALLLVACGLFACELVLAADDDLVEKKLTAMKTEYEKGVAKARTGLLEDLKKKEEAAQKMGDLKKLEMAQAEAKAFEDRRELPKSVPVKTYETQLRSARSKLEEAYATAVRDYTKGGKIELAKAVQQQLEEFKRTNVLGKGAVADDGFGVGTKLVGTGKRSWLGANGKRVNEGYDLELEVTKRSGKEFTAQMWGTNRKSGLEVEGVIENGIVKFSSTKSLTEDVATIVGLHKFTGRFENGMLKGTSTKKGDDSYRGEMDLKLKTK